MNFIRHTKIMFLLTICFTQTLLNGMEKEIEKEQEIWETPHNHDTRNEYLTPPEQGIRELYDLKKTHPNAVEDCDNIAGLYIIKYFCCCCISTEASYMLDEMINN